MNRRSKRLVSILVLAMLAFSHATLALAVCAMERGDLQQMSASEHDCCDHDVQDDGSASMSNQCLSHCTSDLQAFGYPSIAAIAPAVLQVFFIAAHQFAPGFPPDAHERPPAAVPPRILLHSFLI